MPRESRQGVRTTGRIEPATRRQRWAQPPTVRDDRRCQKSATRRTGKFHGTGHGALRSHRAASGRVGCSLPRLPAPAPATGRVAARRALARSAASRRLDAFAAAGCARTTSALPAGSSARCGRTRWRSRRRTVLRTTAPPTARDTMKPARAGTGPAPSPIRRWTTSVLRPARRPVRTAVVNSLRRRSRCARSSMPPPSGPRGRVRPTGVRGPWRGEHG